MRRFVPPAPRRSAFAQVFAGIVIAVALAITTISAQIPGRNVNMVSGTKWPEGDPFLQRQNEPSIAASTRNPLHLLGGSNDYRTVDLPFPDDNDEETGDAWLGLFKSFDGGQRWSSTLLPGYRQDESEAGKQSPLKGYQAGADAVVRAGTHGLIYYSGLAFDRGDNGKSGIFLARFIDNNNKENGDPIAYLGTTMVASATGARFLDKPWMIVDMPRPGAQTCEVSGANVLSTEHKGKDKRAWFGFNRGKTKPPNSQRIPAGAVYVAYSVITGEGAALRSEIMLTRSMDCGQTWSTPFRVSRSEDQINQGASITIDPRSGTVYVAWRRFSPSTATPAAVDLDAMMVATLPFGGRKFDSPSQAHSFSKARGRKIQRRLDDLFEHRGRENENRHSTAPEEAGDVAEFDQGSSYYSFRSNAYPTMAADGTGRVYIAWTQRGFSADAGSLGAGARIVMITTRDGRSFTQPRAVDDHAQLGHQLMPTLAFAGGRLMLVYYDLRETRANTHGTYVTDQRTVSSLRQTIDIRAAMARPGDYPDFDPSVKVSNYLMGIHPVSKAVQALQVNPPNLPMFRQGTTPFIGDYIDVAAAPAFVPNGKGGWAYNIADTGRPPVFHAAWTDNRDVRPPVGGDWTRYTPARMSQNESDRTSKLTGASVPACEPGNAGSRNQNVYSARITAGLVAGSPANSKPLSPTLQRGFVVFAQNATDAARSFRMTIRNQPVGGRASFEQFAPNRPPLTLLNMQVPPRSTAARTVYATSTDRHASITVDVIETTPPAPNGEPLSLGLSSSVLLNPDIENPDIENPDIENGVMNPDIENAEVYNPAIENPDIENPNVTATTFVSARVANPDIENPDIENPDIENPDIENVLVANPDIENLNISNPDIENPDIENPDIENPDIENPDIENGSIADVTWKVSNTGNTAAAFNVNIFLGNQVIPAGVNTQLILFKTYRTPVTVPNNCQLGFQTRNVLVSSILRPTFVLPSSGGVANPNDPSDKNASMWLAPGEEGRITLRVIDDDISNNLIITKADGSQVSIDPALAPQAGLAAAVSSQSVSTADKAAGEIASPLVTPTGGNLFFLQMPIQATTGVAMAPPVTVQVRDDRTGVPVSGAVVSLSLGANPTAAVLSGNLATSNANGVAVFPALTVSVSGAGYTLAASATSANRVIATAISTPFIVTDPLAVATASLPSGTAGLPYSQALLSTGGGGATRTWTVVSGSLPTGLALSDTGIVSGTIEPSTRGAFAFTVQVMDGLMPARMATRAFSISVGAIADISLGLASSPDPVYTNAELTYAITVANAGPSTATQLAVSFTMPPSATFISGATECGLPVNGVITCAIQVLPVGGSKQLAVVMRPGTAGNIESTATAAAIEPDPIMNNIAVESTTVLSSVTIAMPSAENRTAESGVPYALTLSATGGVAPYAWSLVSGTLPSGLALHSTLGTITGTTSAATAAAYTFSVRATDSLGSVHTITICLTVRPAVSSVVSTRTLGDGLTLEEMVTTLLRGGAENESVAVSNIRLNGNPRSVSDGVYEGAGIFEGGAGILGIDRGLLLSSGAVSGAKGPNNSDGTTTTLGTEGDLDLQKLARASGTNQSVVTHDATVLEFDFVPTGNKVSFRYVFGSEEYNEFVASDYNDAFGFFITDPLGNKRNYALVPNTAEPVTINSINGGNPFGTILTRNAHLYRNNDPSDGGATISIQADGLTVVLTLIADVTPGQTHTMKLAIADAGDSALDSWVFIEAGSLRVVENCTNGMDDDGDGLVDGNDPDCAVCAGTEQPAGAEAAFAVADKLFAVETASAGRQPSWLARRRRRLAALQPAIV